jgi:hypothetical protein
VFDLAAKNQLRLHISLEILEEMLGSKERDLATFSLFTDYLHRCVNNHLLCPINRTIERELLGKESGSDFPSVQEFLPLYQHASRGDVGYISAAVLRSKQSLVTIESSIHNAIIEDIGSRFNHYQVSDTLEREDPIETRDFVSAWLNEHYSRDMELPSRPTPDTAPTTFAWFTFQLVKTRLAAKCKKGSKRFNALADTDYDCRIFSNAIGMQSNYLITTDATLTEIGNVAIKIIGCKTAIADFQSFLSLARHNSVS